MSSKISRYEVSFSGEADVYKNIYLYLEEHFALGKSPNWRHVEFDDHESAINYVLNHIDRYDDNYCGIKEYNPFMVFIRDSETNEIKKFETHYTLVRSWLVAPTNRTIIRGK